MVKKRRSKKAKRVTIPTKLPEKKAEYEFTPAKEAELKKATEATNAVKFGKSVQEMMASLKATIYYATGALVAALLEQEDEVDRIEVRLFRAASSWDSVEDIEAMLERVEGSD